MITDIEPRGNEVHLSYEELALYRAHLILKKYLDTQQASDVITELLNNGVVLRMSQWFIENYGEEKQKELAEVERMEDEGGPAST